ncbi:MAG: ABC transporter permease [Planctomycetota bacterium]|nr:ABC transporter permease [Planctomycetota bacterium]
MNLRWQIIRILLGKQLLRLKKNTAAYALLGLLMAIAILMATGSKTITATETAAQRQTTCWIVFHKGGGWLDHLREHLPHGPSVEQSGSGGLDIQLVSRDEIEQSGSELVYPPHSCAIEVFPAGLDENERHRIRFLHSGDERSLAPYTRWFWKNTAEFFGQTGPFDEEVARIQRVERKVDAIRDQSISDVLTPELVGTVLLFAVQFFLCCHLLVSFTSQDRERGTLLALALSPASVPEILAAKFVFHVGLSVIFSAAVVCILKPVALAHAGIWVVVVLASIGFTSVGIVLASLAKTQSSAGLLTMCYMLIGGVISYLATSFSTFAMLQRLTFENYSFALGVASMKYAINPFVIPAVGTMAVLVTAWTIAAGYIFHRRGWQ